MDPPLVVRYLSAVTLSNQIAFPLEMLVIRSLVTPFRDPAESDELRLRLRDALAKLPVRQRSVIVLHDVEGFKHSEIGKMLGIPEGTARSDLHYARSALRALLQQLRSPR